jgi:hypothetical protein
MKKLLFFILAFSMHVAAYAADSFSTLEERMSGKEFKETGLGKLTTEELATLNEWLRRHSVATLENASASSSASAGASEDTRGFYKQSKYAMMDKVIHSTIEGTFSGWSGKGTLFKLSNGMVWQQDEKDTFYVEPVENPEITITKSMLGRWYLKMVEHDSKVRVKRVN